MSFRLGLKSMMMLIISSLSLVFLEFGFQPKIKNKYPKKIDPSTLYVKVHMIQYKPQQNKTTLA